MAYKGSISDTGQVLTLTSFQGVDYFTNVTALDPTVLSRNENTDLQRGVVDRRDGAVKVAQLSVAGTAGASRTFGTTAKYATFTPTLIPTGGFAIQLPGLVATRTANTSWIVGSRPSGQTYHVFKVSLSSAGVLTVAWHDADGTDHTITSSTITDGATVHLLLIYDAVAGTNTLYINGSSDGTPETGLASTLKPIQTAGVVWTFGVEKQTGSAVTANSQFVGAHDGMTIHTLRGMRPASGTTTLAETLRRHSARVWPTPQMDSVLAHYDMDEASGTVMYDRSRFKNHGTYVGGPSVTSPVALLSAPCNYIGFIDVPAGKWNLCGSFGGLQYQAIGGLA